MMATGFPELNTPVDGESGTPSHLSVDAEECSEDVPSSSLDSSSSWESQTFSFGYLYDERHVSEEKLHATFVYHKEEGKIALDILKQLEKLSQQPSNNSQWTLGLYGSVRSPSLFGCIEDICEYSSTIILLWTPEFEGDEQCLDISKSIKAQKSVSKVSDIIVIYYGFSDGRKPNRKNIVFNDAVPLDYDNSEYFFEVMKNRLLGAKIQRSAAFPQGHQGKGKRTRGKASSKKPSSSLSKIAGRKAGDDVVQNNTLGKTRTDNDNALPNDVLVDDDKQILVTLTDHRDSPASSVPNLESSQEMSTLLKQSVKQGKSLEEEVSKPKSTEEASAPASTDPSDCSIQGEKIRNDKNLTLNSYQDDPEPNFRTRDSAKNQAHSKELPEGKTNETKLFAISPQACDKGREKFMSNEGCENGTSHLADTLDGGQEHECRAEEKRRNADRTETRPTETLQLTRSGTQDMVSQASLRDGDSLVHTEIPNDSVTPVTSLSTSEVTSKEIRKSSPASDDTSFTGKTDQSQNIQQPKDVCNTESYAKNFQSMSVTASDESRMKSPKESQANSPPLRTNESDEENSYKTQTVGEGIVEETADEAGYKTPEESFCGETEVKSIYDSQSGQTSNHEMENEMTHSTVSKQIFHANTDNISKFRFPISIRDGLNETILAKEMIGMGERSNDGSSHHILPDSREKLPFMDCDYNNILEREIRTHGVVSEPATENYQKSGPDHIHESCKEESTEEMSLESDETTLSHVASSTGFQVQMESLAEVPTHEIHPGIPASTTTGGQTKGLKPLQESWSPEAEYGISENGVKYTPPVQESQPSENLSFFGPYQSVNVVTQSTMTSSPSSPVADCPSTVIINVGKTDGLYVAMENDRPRMNLQSSGASGSGQLPAKPNAWPDLAPSSTRNGAAPEMEKIETDLLADSEENQPRNHSRKNPLLRFLCCGHQKKYKKPKK